MTETTLDTRPLASAEMLTAAEIRTRVNRIQEVMKAVMSEGVHFGKIPGTPKPTLYKPGAEKILTTFRIASKVGSIEDLSTEDEVRYRVTVSGINQISSDFLGDGSGECSSNEAKYKWRAPVCDEEFAETAEDRRRSVWKKGQRGPYQIKQVRTEPADVANTILKMAVKRALVAMTLVVTAASDVFSQDIEDVPEEVRPNVTEDEPPPPAPPQRRSSQQAAPPASSGRSTQQGSSVISDAQQRRLWAIAHNSGWRDDEVKHFLLEQFNVESTSDILRSQYDGICAELEGGRGNE